MTTEETNEMLRMMEVENAELRRKLEAMHRGPGLTLKIGEKGGVSVYGLGRFPVVLYAQQWRKLLAYKDEILNFIAMNHDALSWKDK